MSRFLLSSDGWKDLPSGEGVFELSEAHSVDRDTAISHCDKFVGDILKPGFAAILMEYNEGVFIIVKDWYEKENAECCIEATN